jgi:hypothetical protein
VLFPEHSRRWLAARPSIDAATGKERPQMGLKRVMRSPDRRAPRGPAGRRRRRRPRPSGPAKRGSDGRAGAERGLFSNSGSPALFFRAGSPHGSLRKESHAGDPCPLIKIGPPLFEMNRSRVSYTMFILLQFHHSFAHSKTRAKRARKPLLLYIIVYTIAKLILLQFHQSFAHSKTRAKRARNPLF